MRRISITILAFAGTAFVYRTAYQLGEKVGRNETAADLYRAKVDGYLQGHKDGAAGKEATWPK